MTAWYFLFNFLFVIYIFNADMIYNRLSGISYLIKIKDDLPLIAKGDLKMFAVKDYSPVNNKLGEGKGLRIKFSGIENKNGTAKVRIFFRSTGVLYEVIENRRSFWADKNNTVLNFFASTSALENGVYQIGVYLSDDKKTKFVWMDSLFEKIDGGPVGYLARPITLTTTKSSDDLKFEIERLDKDNKELVFQGWVVLDDAEMNNYGAYITLRNSEEVTKTFYAPLFTRPDIALRYGDPRAANSGFHIKVPRSEFAQGTHRIKIAIKSYVTNEVVEAMQTEATIL